MSSRTRSGESSTTFHNCDRPWTPSRKPAGLAPPSFLRRSPSWGAEIVDELKPTAKDIVVEGKCGQCGFASTNLDFILLAVEKNYPMFSRPMNHPEFLAELSGDKA